MRRTLYFITALLLASLACTLTANTEDGPATPTPLAAIGALATNTPLPSPSPTIDSNATPTAIAAPPTRLPTIQPTPLQFNTPLPPSNAGGNPAPPPLVVGTGNTQAGGSGEVALAGSNPAAGVPQSAGGYYFPDTIVYLSGGSVFAVNETGAGVLTIGTGTASRSSNGLYVATTAGQIIRPDGAAVGSASGLGTAPAWTRDGSVAYWGSGPNLIRYQGGTTSTAASLNGNINAVAFSPDGGTLLFASPQEIKLQYGDGNIGSIWQSGGESITLGPVWAVRGDRVGVYAVLSDGRRVFLSGDMTVLDNPNETLQVISPIQPGARVYLRSEDVGAQRLVAVWPGLPDREFTAISLLHVSWSPDGSQLVYGAPNGGLIWLDVATGEARVLVVGDARFPIWSPPLFSVQL